MSQRSEFATYAMVRGWKLASWRHRIQYTRDGVAVSVDWKDDRPASIRLSAPPSGGCTFSSDDPPEATLHAILDHWGAR